MPTAWLPCPGKVKAIDMMRSLLVPVGLACGATAG
jgi:hypothetical protein